MSDYKYQDRSRGRRDFGGGGRRRAEMHDAVCDKCGKDCKVPFRPSGEKPIYCSDCFEGQGGRDGGRSRGGGRDFSRRGGRGGDKGMSQLGEKMDAVNRKLDTIIELLSDKKPKKKPKPKKKDKPGKKDKPKKKKK